MIRFEIVVVVQGPTVDRLFLHECVAQCFFHRLYFLVVFLSSFLFLTLPRALAGGLLLRLAGGGRLRQRHLLQVTPLDFAGDGARNLVGENHAAF